MTNDLQLIPFTESHADLLRNWLAKPHIAAWYPDPDEVIEAALTPLPGRECAIMALGADPIGYITWAPVTRETLDEVGLTHIPEGAIDIDLLIGDQALTGQGHGPEALRQLEARLREEQPEAEILGLCPSVKNAQARAAYEKAGFAPDQEFDAPVYGRMIAMVKYLNQ